MDVFSIPGMDINLDVVIFDRFRDAAPCGSVKEEETVIDGGRDLSCHLDVLVIGAEHKPEPSVRLHDSTTKHASFKLVIRVESRSVVVASQQKTSANGQDVTLA